MIISDICLILCSSYLFAIWIWWSNETVPLADNGGVVAAADGVHKPVSVVIIDYMDKSPSTSGHPLHQPFTKVIKCKSYLHYLIIRVAITCT